MPVMGNENQTILDCLSDKPELLSLDLDFPECDQVLQVPRDGRDLQVIVPLFYDGIRVGGVVARPHPDGRHCAAIAHTTYSLRTPGLDPAPAASDPTPEGS
jgi:hypothetical protein